jgi:hypothetical protein
MAEKRSWRIRKERLRDPFNPEEELKKRALPSDNDIVIKHPDNESNIRIKDNGIIQMFANGKTGIRLDPKYNSINIFADKTNMFSSSIHFLTDDNGLKWNFTPFNRALSDPLREIVTTTPMGTEALIDSLTSSGAYVAKDGPVSPGTVKSLNNFEFKGIRAYNGEEKLNMLRTIKNAMSGIAQDLDMENIKDLV